MLLPYCVGIFATLYVSTYGHHHHDAAARCKDKPNGVYEAACKSYLTCTNGIAKQEYCSNGEVFNFNTNTCDDPQNALPCGVQMDCSGLDNGRYPFLPLDCKFFYTCHGEQFLGHNKCPDGLAFSTDLDRCEWVTNIFPPCGTKHY